MTEKTILIPVMIDLVSESIVCGKDINFQRFPQIFLEPFGNLAEEGEAGSAVGGELVAEGGGG